MSTTTMATPEPTTFTELVAATTAAATAAVLGLQQLIRRLGDTRKEVARTGKEVAQVDAQTQVTNALREELTRMGEQNIKLANCLNALQIEVITLRGENAELHTTIRHLHSEVKRLRQAGARSDFAPLDEQPGG